MATKETIKRREYQRRYHEQHRAKQNDCARSWYYADREKVLARHKERMVNDPKYAEKIRASARRTYALRQKKARKVARDETRKGN